MSAESPGLLDAALDLHRAGLCVLPAAEDGSKRPAVDWKTYQEQRPDESQVRRWFSGSRTGLGIVCGAVSGGLELTEFEGRAVAAGAVASVAAAFAEGGDAELWARLTSGYVVASPSGGAHFLYFVEGDVGHNTKLAAQADHVTLAETRGEGGWVVTAPSHGDVHPTGGAWRALAGSPGTIPTLTADERERFHGYVRTLDERPAPEPAGAASVFSQPRLGSGDGVSPGDDFATRTGWPEILEPLGWRFVFARGDVAYWRRPGKSTGISASTGYGDGGDWLYVWTSSTELTPETTYTKFGAFAALNHGGDHKAAAADLQRRGFGKRTEVVTMPATRASSSVPSADGTAALAPVLAGPQPMMDVRLNDVGNAALLVSWYGDRLRYVPERGAWLRWSGHRWESDDAGEHVELAKATLLRALDHATDDTARKHFGRSLSRKGVEATVALARTDPAIVAPQAKLDALDHLLCTPGGVVDLRTGAVEPATPAELHTRSTSVAPDATQPTPRWDRFLAETYGGDAELIGYVQRLAGYSATGIVDAHVLPFLFGASGQNGKSVILKVFGTVLGGYAGSAPGSFLTTGPSQHETEIARLAGLRFVVCSEVERSATFAEAKVKMLTGGDDLTARFMRRDHFSWSPTHHLWLMANHRPQVSAGGNSFWRRLRLLNHPFQVAVEDRIEGLDRQLVDEEGPGILAWIVAGARAYFATGLADPASVLAATEEYATSEDDLGRFVAERLIVAETAEARRAVATSTAALVAAYASWCHDEGVEPVSAKRLGSELRGRWGIEGHRSNGKRFYLGVTIAADEDAPTFYQPVPDRLPYH